MLRVKQGKELILVLGTHLTLHQPLTRNITDSLAQSVRQLWRVMTSKGS